MPTHRTLRNLSQAYLTLVPFAAVILAFAIGHISYRIYIPIWCIHACVMAMAAWALGAHMINNQDMERRQTALAASFFILPWIFISIFFGMGPPPSNPAGWVATATEQQIRFGGILVLAGVLVACGFATLREKLKAAGENLYSLLGFTAVMIAIPLYIINMTYWGAFLVESFRIFVASGAAKRPDWYFPLREQFGLISTIEVGLFYLATIAFAASLKRTGIFRPGACNIYIIISLLGFLLDLMPPSSPEPLATIGYLVAIPAFPFIMPYLMAINLLRSSTTAPIRITGD
jgi:hypothetical protein